MAAPTCLDVFVGCYERTTLGYTVRQNVTEKKFEIDAKFTDNSHIGCVKTIAANGAYLATGSTDETIHLYNLETNKELGALLQHDGSITRLCFHGNDRLISSSADGTLCIWDTASWELMKCLRAHRGGVNSIAVHPSGKLALSAGQDKNLRTWNLVRGRVAYTTSVKQAVNIVRWAPDGEFYLVTSNNVLTLYSITTATVTSTLDCQRHIHAVSFLTNRIVAVGGEGTNIELFEISDGKLVCRCDFKAHENRIKGVQCSSDCSSQPSSDCRWLVSISSDSYIKLWSVNIETLAEPELLASVDTTARLTCVAVRTMNRGTAVQTRPAPNEEKCEEQAQEVEAPQMEAPVERRDATSAKKRRGRESDQGSKKRKPKTTSKQTSRDCEV